MAAYGSTLTDLGSNLVAQQNADTASKAQQLMFLLGLAKNRTDNAKLGSDERMNDRRFQSEDTRTDAQKATDTLRTMNELQSHLEANKTSRANNTDSNMINLELADNAAKRDIALARLNHEYALQSGAAAAQIPNPAILQAVTGAAAADRVSNAADAQTIADSLTAQISQPWSWRPGSGGASIAAAQNLLDANPQHKGKFIITKGPDGMARFVPNPASVPQAMSLPQQIDMSRPRPIGQAPASQPSPLLQFLSRGTAPAAAPAAAAPASVQLYDQSGKAYLVHPDDVQGYIKANGLSPTPPAPASNWMRYFNVQ